MNEVTIHVVHSCPYWHGHDVWLTELSTEGLEDLCSAILLWYDEPELCPSCMAVVNAKPMVGSDGGDDGRLVWSMHTSLRQSLRSALNDAAYQLVDTDGFTALYRGPSATVTVEWNRTWWTGEPSRLGVSGG
jgi:hypothetical protein